MPMRRRLPAADLSPNDPVEPPFDPEEPTEPSDLDYEDVPCTDDGDVDDPRWDAFIPDDDEFDPEPDRGDFWIENGAARITCRREVTRCTR